MTTFKGLDLFGPGPHRVAVGPRGSFVLPDAALSSPGPNSYAVGVRELDLTVEGRLNAETLAALESQRDAIAAQLLDPPTAGTLVDPNGRAWPGVSFISFEEQGPPERGRAWSLAYTARFRRFNAPPA